MAKQLDDEVMMKLLARGWAMLCASVALQGKRYKKDNLRTVMEKRTTDLTNLTERLEEHLLEVVPDQGD